MFSSAVGASGRLGCRHPPFQPHSPRPPINVSLFSRRRQQSGATPAANYLLEREEVETESVRPDLADPSAGVQRLGDKSTNIDGVSSDEIISGAHDDAASEDQRKQAAGSGGLPKTTPTPQPQLRWRRTRDAWHLSEDPNSIDLGTDALGQPATIRILRNQERRRKTAESITERPAPSDGEVGAEELAQLALSPPPAADAKPHEVDAIIHKLKDELLALRQPNGSFRRQHYERIIRHLFEGFTYKQLEAYYSRQKQHVRTTDVHNLEYFFKSPLLTRTRWFSGSSKSSARALKRLDESNWNKSFVDAFMLVPKELLVGNRLTPKTKRIERILRKLWGVRSQDELGTGELALVVHNPIHLELLLKHHKRVFLQRSEQLGVRIEIHDDHSLIRIMGQYNVTADVFRLILGDLENVRCTKISLEENMPNAPQALQTMTQLALGNSVYIAQVEQLTNTRVFAHPPKDAYAPASLSLDIYYLGPDQSDLDDARRIILQSLERGPGEKKHVQCDRSRGSRVPVQVPIEPGGLLPLQDRHTRWYRWTYDVHSPGTDQPIDASSTLAAAPVRGADSLKLASQAANILLPAWGEGARPSAPLSPYWGPRVNHELYALGGFITYPLNPQLGPGIEDSAPAPSTLTDKDVVRIEAKFDALLASGPRRLLAGIPELWKGLNNSITGSPIVRNSLLIRLKPMRSTSHPPQSVRFLPDLELILDMDGKERAELKVAQFVRSWQQSDLLMPARAIDLRFVARALAPSSEQIDPALHSFVQASQLDVSGAGRLHTPARLTLAVPRLAYDVAKADFRGGAATPPAAAAAAPAASLTADYYFADLEHHSALLTRCGGFLLRYSTIEAGRTGGRREELRFDLAEGSIAASSRQDAETEQRFHHWFDSVRQWTVQALG